MSGSGNVRADGKLSGNMFEFYGIKCTVGEKEYWGVISGNHKTVLVETNIIDKENKSNTVKFANPTHDGTCFKKLFEYIRDLNNYNTHKELNYQLKKRINS